jgi:hypothetical protein
VALRASGHGTPCPYVFDPPSWDAVSINLLSHGSLGRALSARAPHFENGGFGETALPCTSALAGEEKEEEVVPLCVDVASAKEDGSFSWRGRKKEGVVPYRYCRQL